MKREVTLSIHGHQSYQGQPPEEIELVTEGFLQQTAGGWQVSYEESDLTGMSGVTTVFRAELGKITLLRSGKLHSQMVFQEGVSHDSLYQLEFGALMVTVCAKTVDYELTEDGGTIDLVYSIEIEKSAVGIIAYHLEIQTKHE